MFATFREATGENLVGERGLGLPHSVLKRVKNICGFGII